MDFLLNLVNSLLEKHEIVSPCSNKCWPECLGSGHLWFNNSENSTLLAKVSVEVRMIEDENGYLVIPIFNKNYRYNESYNIDPVNRTDAVELMFYIKTICTESDVPCTLVFE